MSAPESSTAARPRRRRLVLGAALLGLAGLAFWWLDRAMPGTSFEGPRPVATVQEVALADRLEQDVRTLATDIGERNMLSFDQLAAAAEWITGELAAAGWEVRRQVYELNGYEPANLEVERRGSSRPDEIVVVGAHYDTVRGSPGANDDASGVAAVLALARAFAETDTARTLRFVFFVNQEAPWYQTDDMGALVYARACADRGEDVVAMLSLDCVGFFSDDPGSQHLPSVIAPFYPDAGNFVAIAGNLESSDLVRTVMGTFREHAELPSEGGSMPGALPGVSWSDHWAFWECGYPGVVVSDTGYFRDPLYHRRGDEPERLDYDGLARLVEGLEPVVTELVSAPE